jgi:hypothetical protein
MGTVMHIENAELVSLYLPFNTGRQTEIFLRPLSSQLFAKQAWTIL